MECNNKHCVFNAFDQCCHESEEGFDNATPNELDCPSSVRVDIQENMFLAVHEIQVALLNKNHRELSEIISLMNAQKGKRK